MEKWGGVSLSAGVNELIQTTKYRRDRWLAVGVSDAESD